MIFFLLSSLSADPWSRPEHIRVVQKPPQNWAQLWKNKYPHRFWWDRTEEKAEIQWLSAKGWKTIKKNADPGWKTCWSYPLGSRFRLRFPSSTRWSDIVQASAWVSPLDFQLFQKDKKNLPSRPTILRSTQDSLWTGSIDGGLFSFDSKNRFSTRRRWDGLWDDRIIALDGHQNQLLVGTANGAVLFVDGAPVQAWQDEFQSPYIQAVSIQNDDLWIGSFRGLYRIRGGEFETKLHTHSVFSIHPFQENETLVGFEGLQYFTQKDAQFSYPEWGNIYGIAIKNDAIWLSSNKLGVVSIKDQIMQTHFSQSPNHILFDQEGLWMADSLGLYTPQQKWEKRFGSVFHLHKHKQDLWIASDKGIFQYDQPKEIIPTSYQKPDPKAFLYSDNKGFVLQGSTPLTFGKPASFSGSQSQQGWHNISVQGDWIDIEAYNDFSWTLNTEGIWLHTANGSAKLKHKHKGLKNIEASALSVWAQTEDDTLLRFTLNKKEEYNVYGIQAMSSGRKSLCVASRKGLFRIWIRKEDPIEHIHKKNEFEAVYSTEEGDCWFASAQDQVGIWRIDGSKKVWDTPPHLGTIYHILPHANKGLWVYSSKGLWLLRMREE